MTEDKNIIDHQFLQDIYRDHDSRLRDHGHRISSLETNDKVYREMILELKGDRKEMDNRFEKLNDKITELRISIGKYIGIATGALGVLQVVVTYLLNKY